MIKAVIFDMDGTLIDSVDLHAKAWQDAFLEFGHTFDLKAIRDQIGKGGDQLLPVFLNTDEITKIGADIERRRGDILKQRCLSEIKAFPDVPQLFQRLRSNGIKTVLASSAKSDELKTYKKIAGIDGLTNAETSSDDAEKSKPYPDIFQAAMGKLKGIDGSEVVVVGEAQPEHGDFGGRAAVCEAGRRA